MARDWSQLGQLWRGGTLPGQLFSWMQFARGKEGQGPPLMEALMPYKQEPSIAGRPAMGLEGQAAAQEQARTMQSVLNQQLTSSIIPAINREYASAGRYASGQRLGAIGRATGGAQQALGQGIGQNALQVYLAQLQAQETRDWRQAQIDMAEGQKPGFMSGLGQLAPYLAYAAFA